MFRIAIASLVLAIAVGPGASVLCKSSCEAASATTGCSHAPQSAQTVAASNDCSGVGLFTAVIREDLRRGESSLNVDGLAPTAPYTLEPFRLTTYAPHIGPFDASRTHRPLSVALRI